MLKEIDVEEGSSIIQTIVRCVISIVDTVTGVFPGDFAERRKKVVTSTGLN